MLDALELMFYCCYKNDVSCEGKTVDRQCDHIFFDKSHPYELRMNEVRQKK